MPTTTNMVMVLPTDHASLDVWGAALNAALTSRVDVHNHTTGLGVQVPVAGLNINADLSFGGTRAITNALALDMTPTVAAAVSAYSSALFTDNSNNLFFRNSGGTNIQITAGNQLNFSVTGGFGGDYSSVGALAQFIDASDLYQFLQQLGGGVRQYARVAHADLDLFEYKANPAVGVPTTRVRQKSPAGLAGSYDLTWLAALPASEVLLSVDNTGQIRSNAGNALPNNTNIVLSGTGTYKQGQKHRLRSFVANHYTVAAGSISFGAGNASVQLQINTDAYFPIEGLDTHERLVSLTINLGNTPAASVSYALFTAPAPGSVAFIATAFSASGATNTITIPTINTAGNNWWLRVTTPGTATASMITYDILYDVP